MATANRFQNIFSQVIMVPFQVIQDWPLILAYAGLNFVSDTIMTLIPQPRGGMGKQIVGYLVNGVNQASQQVLFEVVK